MVEERWSLMTGGCCGLSGLLEGDPSCGQVNEVFLPLWNSLCFPESLVKFSLNAKPWLTMLSRFKERIS